MRLAMLARGPVSLVGTRSDYGIQRQLSTESPGLARHGEASPIQLAQLRAGPPQRRLWTYMVRPAMQEEISVNMKDKLQSYIRHLVEED
jgi:hypothetical protein